MRKLTCLLLLFTTLFLSPISYLFVSTVFAGTISSAPIDVSVSATVEGGTVTQTPIGSGGGALNGPITIPKTSVRFSGSAYPNATVTLLKDGNYATSVKEDKQGLFDITLEEQYNGTMLYSLQAVDTNNEKSLLINYPLVVESGYLTYLSGILFPPTITLDKMQVAAGDYLTVAGFALPQKEMQIVIEDRASGTNTKTFTLTSPSSGYYDITLPMMYLPEGDYSIYIKYGADSRVSKLVRFTIGDTNISSLDNALNIPGDCNADQVINLVDFSILAFWYKKPNPPKCVDINHDGIVDLIDFSILAFYWTD